MAGSFQDKCSQQNDYPYQVSANNDMVQGARLPNDSEELAPCLQASAELKKDLRRCRRLVHDICALGTAVP